MRPSRMHALLLTVQATALTKLRRMTSTVITTVITITMAIAASTTTTISFTFSMPLALTLSFTPTPSSLHHLHPHLLHHFSVHTRQWRAGHVVSCQAVAAGGHTTVAGAVQAPIGALADAEAILRRADQARSTASTAMNAHSSRSHSVLMLHIAGSHGPTGTSLRGSLNLVDLAGRCCLCDVCDHIRLWNLEVGLLAKHARASAWVPASD